MGTKGWHRRGYLPHLDGREIVQHVVFRLADALPLGSVDDPDLVLDRGLGASVLRDPVPAEIVARALLHFNGDRYRLRAWCVMPNHVHALVDTFGTHELGAIVRSWKAFSAAKINKVIGRNGALWARDYFDRFMRDDGQLHTTVRYIEMNPVAAGLCASPQEWPFSSAGWRG